MFVLRVLATILLAMTVVTAKAEEFRIGPDAFVAGERGILSSAVEGDAFLAGETVQAAAEIGGSAHMAGRDVRLDSDVAQNVYAAGYSVTLNAAIGQSASLAGYEIDINGEIGGSVRASGAEIAVNGAIGGPALLTGGRVALNAPISGDVMLTTGEVVFGEGARIDGALTLTAENADDIAIPESVISADRITRIQAEHGEGDIRTMAERQVRRGIAGAIWGFVQSVLVVTVIAAVVAALAPGALAATRARMLDAPVASFGWGFAMLSALIGSAFVLALSILGIMAIPVSIIAAVIAAMAGYVIGAYSIGVAAFNAAGRGTPETFAARALRAAAGALLIGVIALIPFLGWLVAGAVSLTGLGAITHQLLRPRLFS